MCLIERHEWEDRQSGTPNLPATLTLDSTILREKGRIYAQLPEGYARTQARYPVLVVLDGEWLFELARANVRFFSEYDVMDVTIPKMIIIGHISWGGSSRLGQGAAQRCPLGCVCLRQFQEPLQKTEALVRRESTTQ